MNGQNIQRGSFSIGRVSAQRNSLQQQVETWVSLALKNRLYALLSQQNRRPLPGNGSASTETANSNGWSLEEGIVNLTKIPS